MTRGGITIGAEDTPRPNLVRVPRLLRAIFGVRERLVIGGVRYREITQEPLRRALSKRGSGYKDYAARFPAGRRMRIRVSPARSYEDLSGPVLLGEYRRYEELVRPGSRALVMRSGTGYAAAWLAERVGPSGAVVAIDDDGESVRYARWRYPLPNVAFEQSAPGRIEGELAGETDGGFDAVLAIHALHARDDAPALLRELWRVTAPGGWLGLVVPGTGSAHVDTRDPMSPRVLSRAGLEEVLRDGGLLADGSAALSWLTPSGSASGGEHSLAVALLKGAAKPKRSGRTPEDEDEQI